MPLNLSAPPAFCSSALAIIGSNLAYGSWLSPRYPLKPFVIGPPVAGKQVTDLAQATLASRARSSARLKAARAAWPGVSAPLVVVGSQGVAPGLSANGPSTKLKPTAVVCAPGKRVSSFFLVGSA